MKLIAQIFGSLAICCSLIIYSRKDRKKLLTFKCVQDICWFIHYIILSAFSAAASSALCVLRSVIFYGSNKKQNKCVLFVFLILYAFSAFLTWKSMFSILPAASSSISTVAFWVKDTKKTKILAIFASLCTLGYNIAVANSPSVYVGVSFTIITALLSLTIKKKNRSDE